MKIDAFENRLDAPGKPGEPIQKSAALTAPPQTINASQAGLNSGQLRQILREELRDVTWSDERQAQSSAQVPETAAYDATEMQYRRELVLEGMDLLKQQENVSSSELDKLLGDIAQLEPETRTEMLREFTQAMNRGEINGPL